MIRLPVPGPHRPAIAPSVLSPVDLSRRIDRLPTRTATCRSEIMSQDPPNLPESGALTEERRGDVRIPTTIRFSDPEWELVKDPPPSAQSPPLSTRTRLRSMPPPQAERPRSSAESWRRSRASIATPTLSRRSTATRCCEKGPRGQMDQTISAARESLSAGAMVLRAALRCHPNCPRSQPLQVALPSAMSLRLFGPAA